MRWTPIVISLKLCPHYLTICSKIDVWLNNSDTFWLLCIASLDKTQCLYWRQFILVLSGYITAVQYDAYIFYIVYYFIDPLHAWLFFIADEGREFCKLAILEISIDTSFLLRFTSCLYGQNIY